MTAALHNCTGDDTRRDEKWWRRRAEQEIGSDYNSRFHFFAVHSCDISGSILSALINLIRQIIIIYGPTDTCLDFCGLPVRQSVCGTRYNTSTYFISIAWHRFVLVKGVTHSHSGPFQLIARSLWASNFSTTQQQETSHSHTNDTAAL